MNTDLRQECLADMSRNNLPLGDDFIADSKVHRYSADRNTFKRDEWYIAQEGLSERNIPYLICTYGSWTTGEKFVYRSFVNKEKNNPQEYKHLMDELRIHNERARIFQQQELKKLHDNTARRASDIYEKASLKPTTENQSKYLEKKKIKAYGLKECPIRYTTHNGFDSMLIPILDADKNMWSLGVIYYGNDGMCYKRFLKGGCKKGKFYPLSDLDLVSTIYVTEGYATAASVFEVLDDDSAGVVVAFDAGNIFPVVEALRKKYSCEIIVAADNDDRGLSAAKKTCKAFGCLMVYPEFLNDFNDMHVACKVKETRDTLTRYNHKENIMLNNSIPILAEKDADGKLLCDLCWNPDNPCSDFTLDYLPPNLKRHLENSCATTHSHKIIVTTSFLASNTGFFGNRMCYKDGDSVTLYPNMWGVCIAPTGQLKSTGLKVGSRLANKREDEVIDFEMSIAEDLKKGIITEERYEMSSSNNEKRSVKLAEDGSISGLTEDLSLGHGGVILCDELSSLIKNLNKKHNEGGMDFLTSAYSGGNNYKKKTKSGGRSFIKNPFISIFGVTTMSWFEDCIEDKDIGGGFWTRFLIFTPDTGLKRPPYSPPSTKIDKVLEDEVAYQLSKIDPINVRCYGKTSEANELYQRIYDAIYDHIENNKDAEILKGFASRWTSDIWKIGIKMEYFLDPRSLLIGKDSVLAAFSIIKPAVDSTMKTINSGLALTREQKKQEKVFKVIERKFKQNGNKSVMRRDIVRSNTCDNSIEYDKALKILEESGRIIRKKTASNKTYCYNPIKKQE